MTPFYTQLDICHSYIKTMFSLALMLLIAYNANAEDHSAGCLILQTNDAQKLKIESGAIGQTMVPCTGGSLDYMTFFVESTSSETFTAELRVWDQNTLLSRQQIVIPSQGSNTTKVWLVEPPLVTEGKEYTLEIEAPEGKSFFAYYSETDLYHEGNMRINDLLTTGDLAFEAGIRLSQKQKKKLFSTKAKDICTPIQGLADGTIAANTITHQSFLLCENLFIQGLTLQYLSDEACNAMVYIYEAQDNSGVNLLSIPFSISQATSMTPLYIDFPSDFILQGDTEYLIKLATASGDFLPESFSLYMTEQNNYANGSLETLGTQLAKDLTFELHLGESAEFNEQDQNQLFEAYPDHECTISQPYAQQKTTFTSGTIELNLQICDDGELEAVYFMGKQNISAGQITFELKDERDHTIRTGTLSNLEDYEQTLFADLKSAPVVYYFQYKLILTIPEGSELELHSSMNKKHAHFKCIHNGQPLESNLVMVNAMKPYVVEFTGATDDLNAVQLTAYPNPFISDFNIEISGVPSGVANVSVYDFQGNLVFENKIEGSLEPITLKVVPEIALQRGYYTLRVDYKDQVLLETVMKQ